MLLPQSLNSTNQAQIMKPITRNPKSTAIAHFRWLAFLLAVIFAPSLVFAANGPDTWVDNNSITLTGDIVNNSTSLETINLPITSTAARTFTTTAGGGNLTLGGVFSDSGGGIIKVATLGTLTLNGTAANTYTGPTTVNGGLLVEDFTNAT